MKFISGGEDSVSAAAQNGAHLIKFRYFVNFCIEWYSTNPLSVKTPTYSQLLLKSSSEFNS